MAVMPADLERYYSIGSTSSTTSSSQASSLGGTIATTLVSVNAGGLFANVPLAQAVAGRTRYRCVYVKNTHATLTLTDVRVYVESGELDVALDPAAVGSNSTTVIGAETSAPAGVTFAGSAVDYESGLQVGSLAPGEKKAIWVKCVTLAGAPNTIKISDVAVFGLTPV